MKERREIGESVREEAMVWGLVERRAEKPRLRGSRWKALASERSRASRGV